MDAIIINPAKADWQELTGRPQINAIDLQETVLEIINNVKEFGDKAVKDYSLKFHGFIPESLWVTEEEISLSPKTIDKDLKKAILIAKKNIEKFHNAQVNKIKKIKTSSGVVCWRKSVPVENVGLYIPGGSAPLFSTLLMLAIPAKIAGCNNIMVTTPANKNGNVDDAILFVADILGLKNIYKGGGAQAIAALAYGTQTVEKADKIFGPGNQYVTYAKKLVSMDGVAIDMLAGPSELAVYADDTCVPAFVAADLLSQAEHGPDSQVVLVAANKQIIEKIIEEIHGQLPKLERKEIIEQSFLNRRFLVFNEVKEAPQLSPKKNKPFKLAGLVVDAQHRVTKTGRNFGSLCIEDFTGKTELMLWSDDYVKFQNYLEKGKNVLVQGEFKTRFNSEQYEFKVTSVNMLDTAKAAYTKQLIVDVNAQDITPRFVQFIDKNIKANPGKSTLKFNINDPLQHLKIGLYTLEKGFCMNDEMVAFIEENKDLEVSVVCV